ncbi:hypothetical protein [Streptomyces sp. NRRL S-87]|uniref:hypothetical protein n=1 Tax=Streptomyces sp. NRRL S-87 TaxID=1463920 RepID=UPI0004C16735|nr:hypothetical protein [Streptomyces sp. NRRL S-87]
MHRPNTAIARFWAETPKQIRRLSVLLLPLGTVLFFVGLRLDATDGWTGHDYLLNVYSGLTGACFGIPVALLLLNRLTSAQDEVRQAEQARQRAGEEATAFQQSLLSGFEASDLADLTTRVAALQAQLADLRLKRADDPARSEAVHDFLAAFDRLLPSPSGDPRPSLGALHHTEERAAVSEWRSRIRVRWTVLNTEVRPTLHGQDWPEAVAAEAQHACERLLVQGRNPWKSTGAEAGGVTAMLYFLQDVDALCRAATALEIYK